MANCQVVKKKNSEYSQENEDYYNEKSSNKSDESYSDH